MPGRRRQKRTERSKLDATPPWEQRVRGDLPATEGPFDERDAPEDEVARVDLGALHVPVGPDYDLRLDLDENQQVVSATLAVPEGTMQVGVFAAPRAEGIWDEVRAEIAESLNAQKRNNAAEQDGPFGTELHATIPAEDERGKPTTVPVRFVGIDGPRWFVRAMFAGPVARDAAGAKVLEDALRGTVVVRGTDPLPVREPVALKLPDDIELPDPDGNPDTGPDTGPGTA